MFNSSLPKISIVTPSYNQGNYLEKTLLSIIEQGYDNYELIVIDGGSQDNSVEVLKKYNKYISHWESNPDKGQSDAIQKGLELCTGEVFNWINSDDFLEPGSLSLIGDHFSTNPNIDVLCGFTRCFYDEDNTTSHIYRMGLKGNTMDTILGVEMNQPGTFYRTDKVKQLGGVNSSLRYIFDNELWFKYLSKFGIDKVGTTDKQLAQFRLHKTSKTVFDGFAQFEKESNAIWLFLAKELNIPSVLIDSLRQMPYSPNYKSSSWDFTYFETEKFIDFFACKFLITLLEKKEKVLSERGLRFRRSQKEFKWNRMHLSAWLKLNFLN